MNQNINISANQRVELIKKANGLIFLKKKRPADMIANIFTSTISTLISFLLIK